MPGIPTGTGTGTGDLDAIFNKSLGDFDGAMAGEREIIAAAGGGSAKSAGQREQGDADAVAGVDAGGAYGSGDDASGTPGDEGQRGTAGPPGGGATQGSGGMPGTAGQPEQGGGTAQPGQPGSGTGTGEPSASEGKPAVKLPDDIPADGSGDDVVGRQIREAAIAMQETNPEAAEKLWDEYRKHTGIR